jgi:hypothetical protein
LAVSHEHLYSVFGLRVSSDCPLPLLAAPTGEVSLTIGRASPLGRPAPGGRVIHELLESRPDSPRFRLTVWDSAMAIEHGECVVTSESGTGVIKYSSATRDPEAVWPALTRLALPMIVLRRETSYIALHGSAVTFAGGAWILVGPSGAGKSTAVQGLVERGALLLSDDFTLVDAGQRQALPGPPELRLWSKAGETIAGAAAEGLVFDTGKRWFRLRDSEIAPSPATIRGIIHLDSRAGAGPTLVERLPGVGAFSRLLANTFDLSAPPREERERRFRLVASLVANVPSFICGYHKDRARLADHLDRLCEFIASSRMDSINRPFEAIAPSQ